MKTLILLDDAVDLNLAGRTRRVPFTPLRREPYEDGLLTPGRAGVVQAEKV